MRDQILNDMLILGQNMIEPEIIQIGSEGFNHVYSIDKRYVYKFNTPQQTRREARGMLLAGQLSRNAIPLIIGHGKHFLVTEYLNEAVTASSAIEKGQVTVERLNGIIAEMVADIYWNFQTIGRSKVRKYSQLDWEKRLNKLEANLVRNQDWICKYIPNRKFRSLLNKLKKLHNSEFRNNLTFLHRDLHLDNLLLQFNESTFEFRVIDFEHSLIGPLELEFQNAIFWNDGKSVNASEIVKILRKDYGVPYSKRHERILRSLYVADQIYFAVKMKNEWLINRLAERMDEVI